MKLEWAIHAIEDRVAIFEYIEADNPRAALTVDDRIRRQIQQLISHPESGRIGRLMGTRELVIHHTPYIAAYRVADDTLRILRLLHSSQQWPDTLPEWAANIRGSPSRYDSRFPGEPSLNQLSIILPAKNEAPALATLLPQLRAAQPDAEIIVVDDGSTDDTRSICESSGVQCLSSPYSMGNGAAIKRGSRAASGDILVFMDGDGQHDPADVARLLDQLNRGYDMVVGARDWGSQAGVGRGLANTLYNWLATRMTGHPVLDLTSGFRAVRADKFREFLHLLPNGFSYPTTSTMAFFRSAYPVAYLPIKAAQRVGKSHIKPFKDGIRFLLIIFKIATLYSPLKLFVPASVVFFLLGCANYAYTMFAYHRLTNMSTLLWSAAVIVFLIGLVSEQITGLMYRRDV